MNGPAACFVPHPNLGMVGGHPVQCAWHTIPHKTVQVCPGSMRLLHAMYACCWVPTSSAKSASTCSLSFRSGSSCSCAGGLLSLDAEGVRVRDLHTCSRRSVTTVLCIVAQHKAERNGPIQAYSTKVHPWSRAIRLSKRRDPYLSRVKLGYTLYLRLHGPGTLHGEHMGRGTD